MKMERQTLAHMPCYSSRHYAPLPDHGVPCRIRSGRRLQTARSNRAHGSASSSNSLAFGRLAMVYSSTSLPVTSISCRDLCLLSIAQPRSPGCQPSQPFVEVFAHIGQRQDREARFDHVGRSGETSREFPQNRAAQRLRHSRQIVTTGVLCRKASSSICLTRKSATSAREMNPHVQSRGSTNAR